MPVDIVEDNGVGLITLNNPEKLNAWDTEMQRDVTRAVAEFGNTESVRGIVVTGAGDRAFCAGQDLEETGNFSCKDVPSWLDNFRQLYDTFLSSKKPIVAALNGVSAGSGYQLALVCDVRVAHPDVRLGQPEVKSGIPSVTGQYLTSLSLGHSRTTELMLSGRLMDAEEAYRLGLLHQVVDRELVLTTAYEYVRALSQQPRLAFEQTKRRIRDTVWPGLEESFDVALEIDSAAWAAGEPQETAQRFFEERRSRRVSSDASH